MTIVGLVVCCACIYDYERFHRGPGEQQLAGTWQEYDPEEFPDGGSFYEFNTDRTYEVFDYIGNTSKKLTLEKGIWYAGGDFIYFGRTFDYAEFGAVRIWRIEDFSPNQLRIRYDRGQSIFTYKRVNLSSRDASNQPLQPTASRRDSFSSHD